MQIQIVDNDLGVAQSFAKKRAEHENTTRAMRKRCASRAFLLDGVWVPRRGAKFCAPAWHPHPIQQKRARCATLAHCARRVFMLRPLFREGLGNAQVVVYYLYLHLYLYFLLCFSHIRRNRERRKHRNYQRSSQ